MTKNDALITLMAGALRKEGENWKAHASPSVVFGSLHHRWAEGAYAQALEGIAVLESHGVTFEEETEVSSTAPKPLEVLWCSEDDNKVGRE